MRLIKASANALPLEDESVQTVVTSPPYWGLRSYAGEQLTTWADGSVHALGLEPTPELYVAHMVEVFREVRRVLRDDGTLWLNLGDSYAAQGGSREYGSSDGANGRGPAVGGVRTPAPSLKPKDLVGIPWRVAFGLQGFAVIPSTTLIQWADWLREAREHGDWEAVEMVETRLRHAAVTDALIADGWYLRSDIIWHKPNPMPESVTDRPTKAHEYLFLLSKSQRYYYDADAIREAGVGRERFGNTGGKQEVNGDRNDGGRRDMEIVEVRNKRSVWTVATRPYSGAHFATYPPDLIEPCILAGSSPQACGVCGAPWARVVEKGEPILQAWSAKGAGQYDDSIGEMRRTGIEEGSTLKHSVPRETTGWRHTCDHDDGSAKSVVLDPFNGSGTTGLVAVRHNREYVGVDISDEYLDLARQRIDGIQHTLMEVRP
jgi:DNA modification methylase